MPVSGREIASLDFGNLIGGPLNAIVEAQARSAITTANFIREVGFDQDGKVINVDFKYTRKDNDGLDQDFTLTVPFITMLPIPYITVESGTIEFNAKITSVTESHSEQNFDHTTEAGISSNWFVNASLQTKTSYQKKSSSSDKEERTFDMHVLVQVKNQDMPSGTERLLTLLENVMEEKQTTGNSIMLSLSAATALNDLVVTVVGNLPAVQDKATFTYNSVVHTISAIDQTAKTLTFAPPIGSVVPTGAQITIKNPSLKPSPVRSARQAIAVESAPVLPNLKAAATTIVTEMVIDGDINRFTAGSRLSIGGINYTIAGLDPTNNKLLLSAG